MKITNDDYLILKYIRRFASVSEEQINEHLHKKVQSINAHLKYLSNPQNGYIIEEFTVPEDDYEEPPQSKHSYHISDAGLIVLDNYSSQVKLQKQQSRHDWKIAVVSSILGGIFGFLSSLAFWLTTTRLD